MSRMRKSKRGSRGLEALQRAGHTRISVIYRSLYIQVLTKSEMTKLTVTQCLSALSSSRSPSAFSLDNTYICMHRAIIRKEKPAGALIAISPVRVSDRTTSTLMTGCCESHKIWRILSHVWWASTAASRPTKSG
jgi:hypothetical protein